MKDLKHASARGVAWNLLQNVVSRILALAVVAILSRMLDRSAFGGVALALAITTFVELLVNQGYGEFITQTPELLPEHQDTAFWFNVVVAAFFTAVIALTAGPLASWFDEPAVAPVIRLMSLSLLIRGFSVVPSALLVRQLRFRSLSMRTVIASAVAGIVGIAAAASGLGIYSLVLQLLVGDFIATVILWRATDWRPGRRVSRAALKQLMTFGTPIIGATLLGFVSRRFDTVFVGGALGLTMLGVYSMAQRVYQIALQVINKSTTDVAFSTLARLAQSEDRRRGVLTKVVEVSAVVCFPTYVGLAIVAEPLTLTLFGPRWADCVPVLVVFALSGVPFSLSLIHLAAIKSAAATRGLFWINLVLMIVYLPFLALLVERGPAAAATASLISCCAIIPVEVFFMRAAFSLRVTDYLRALGGGTLATLVMAGPAIGLVVWTASWHPVLRLAIVITAGAIVYVSALRLLAPATFRRCTDFARTAMRRSPAS